MALYNTVIVFDQATKLAYVITWVHLDRHESLEDAYQHGKEQLRRTSRKIENEHSPNLTNGKVRTSVHCSFYFLPGIQAAAAGTMGAELRLVHSTVPSILLYLLCILQHPWLCSLESSMLSVVYCTQAAAADRSKLAFLQHSFQISV